MENLSTMDKSTNKDHLINEMVDRTGLSETQVNNLYNQFNAKHGADLKSINESFEEFLKPTAGFDFDKFRSNVIEYSTYISDESLTNDDRDEATYSLIHLIENNFPEADIITALKVVCLILSETSEKFETPEELSDNVFSNLSESVEFKQFPSAKGLSKLYESLAVMLSKNNKRWGSNYHLDNSYTSIMQFLGKEIENIVTEDNVRTTTNISHVNILRDIIDSGYINPMYLHIDHLKKLVPDTQNLVFDLMLLVHTYIRNYENSIQFIKRQSYLDYINSSDALFSQISSSINSSQILKAQKDMNEKWEIENTLLDHFEIDEKKFNVYGVPIDAKIVSAMLKMIKECSNDFNLKLRHLINIYITKALELTIKVEKVKLKNKYI